MRLLNALGLTFFGALTLSAGTITGFTVTNIAQSPFTASINQNVLGSTAYITQSSITCTSITTSCSGGVASFMLTGIGSPGATPITFAIDGTLSGVNDPVLHSTSAVGLITIAPPLFPGTPSSVSFRIDPGTFSNKPITVAAVADLTGAFSFTGTFGFASLAAGQTLNLPGSLSFTVGGPNSAPSSVPEPGSAVLVAGALLGVVGSLKLRSARA